MSRLLLIVALGWTAGARAAEPVMTRSKSGQFVVRGLPLHALPPGAGRPHAVDYVHLDPSVLAVSLERIKAALLAELRQPDEWRGTIYVVLQPRLTDDQPVVVTSFRHPEGWNYRLTVPDLVLRERYVRAVVHALLMEMANRRAGVRPAELPPWLAPGLAAQVRVTSPATLVPEPFSETVGLQRVADPLRFTRAMLQTNSPLTLDQLNLPEGGYLSQPEAPLYEGCAQLFVVSLLKLRSGHECLGRMLAELPECMNWQTAFLRAFAAYFARFNDADKWWSLQVVSATGRAPTSQWTVTETLRQLDEVLDTPVEVRASPDALPSERALPLPTMLREWDFARQEPILRDKLDRLAVLQTRAAPAAIGIVADYRRVLSGYLGRRATGSVLSRPRQQMPPADRLALKDTLQELARLDTRLTAMYASADRPSSDFVSPGATRADLPRTRSR